MSKCFSYISLCFKVLQHRWFTKKNWKNFGIHIINAQETNYGDLFFAVKKIVHNKIEQINNGYSSCQYIPYLSQCNPGVVFFKMGFWVRFNLKNPSKSGLFNKKVGFYSRKPKKTGLFTLPGALFKSGVALERIRYLFGTGNIARTWVKYACWDRNFTNHVLVQERKHSII